MTPPPPGGGDPAWGPKPDLSTVTRGKTTSFIALDFGASDPPPQGGLGGWMDGERIRGQDPGK